MSTGVVAGGGVPGAGAPYVAFGDEGGSRVLSQTSGGATSGEQRHATGNSSHLSTGSSNGAGHSYVDRIVALQRTVDDAADGEGIVGAPQDTLHDALTDNLQGRPKAQSESGISLPPAAVAALARSAVLRTQEAQGLKSGDFYVKRRFTNKGEVDQVIESRAGCCTRTANCFSMCFSSFCCNCCCCCCCCDAVTYFYDDDALSIRLAMQSKASMGGGKSWTLHHEGVGNDTP